MLTGHRAVQHEQNNHYGAAHHRLGDRQIMSSVVHHQSTLQLARVNAPPAIPSVEYLTIHSPSRTLPTPQPSLGRGRGHALLRLATGPAVFQLALELDDFRRADLDPYSAVRAVNSQVAADSEGAVAL